MAEDCWIMQKKIGLDTTEASACMCFDFFIFNQPSAMMQAVHSWNS